MRGRTRGRIRVVAVLLLCVTAAAALILAHRYHLGVAAILVGILGGLPGLYLAWAALPESPGEAGSLDLATVADQLAAAVGEQWQAEAAVRRLNDPYPLPVSWGAAGPSLTDAWDLLVKLAGTGVGWPSPPPAWTWAAGPDGLAGTGGELVEALSRVPTGRLVVLGEPGAGKTMLMVRLVLELLARRTGGGPVPVLASVGSWNPAEQDLWDWLSTRLVVDYPALANPPSPGADEPTQAAALLAAGLIVPILDGLDEIPEGVRGPAISRINDALRPGARLVVTCRSQQFRAAVRPEGGAEVTLRGAAAVELRPLGPDAVRDYLCDDAAGPSARARWSPVLKLLGTNAPVGQALATPLMVGLARAIYNPRPGELAGALRDPAELCDPAVADRAVVESLLFDAFIPAAYRPDPAGRWKPQDPQDPQRWLVFLARYLEFKIAGPDLAWWQLRLAVPGVTFGIAVLAGVLAGAVAAVGAVLGGVSGNGPFIAAVITALAGATAGGVAARLRSPMPARGFRWKRPSLRVVLVGAVPGIAIVILGILDEVGLAFALELGVYYAVAFGLFAWLVTQEGAPLDISSGASPSAVLTRDRRVAVVAGAGAGAIFCAALVLLTVAIGSTNGADFASAVGSGVVFGTTAGAVAGAAVALRTAWPFYGLARAWLALRRQLPWQLMGFLAEAHKRGVLRQAGAVYQFRHIELQHRIATRASDRCTKAIQQLGSDNLDVRTEAIRSLERVARDSATDYPIVIDVLATFIREHSREPQPSGPGFSAPESGARLDIQAATRMIKRLNKGRNRQRVNLSGANLNGADLSGANLNGADLAGANLNGADLAGANLSSADLHNANLRSANLGGANLSDADLHDADLRSARLYSANLGGANLDAADLRGANLDATSLRGANLDNAAWPAHMPAPNGWVKDPTGRLSRRVRADADSTEN